MRGLRLVLRLHLRIAAKRIGLRRWRGVFGLLPVALVLSATAALLGWGARVGFAALRVAAAGQTELAPLLELNLIAGYVLAGAIMIFASAVGSLTASLYDSEDNILLLSTPLSAAGVFAARFGEVVLNHLLVAGPVVLGPLVAYGLVAHASLAYYLSSTVALVALVVIAVAVAALLLMVITRFVPGPRLRRLATVLMFLCLLGLMFSLNLVFFGIKSLGGPFAVLQRLADFGIGSLDLFPHVWLARVAVGAAAGQSVRVPLGALVGLGAILVALLLTLVPQLYLAGWSNSQEAAYRRIGRLALQRYKARMGRATGSRSQFLALASKEFRVAVRSPIFWYAQGVGFVGAGFTIVRHSLISSGRTIGSGTLTLLLGMLIAGASLNGFLFAGTSVSREGRVMPLLLAWPLAPRSTYAAKVAAWLPIPTVVIAVGLSAMQRVLPQASFAPLFIPAFLTVLAVTSLMVTIDAMTPRYRIDVGLSPGTGDGGQSVAKIMTTYYAIFGVVLCMAVFNFPGYYRKLAWAAFLTQEQAVLAGWSGLILLCAILAGLAYRLGTRAMAGIFGDRGSAKPKE